MSKEQISRKECRPRPMVWKGLPAEACSPCSGISAFGHLCQSSTDRRSKEHVLIPPKKTAFPEDPAMFCWAHLTRARTRTMGRCFFELAPWIEHFSGSKSCTWVGIALKVIQGILGDSSGSRNRTHHLLGVQILFGHIRLSHNEHSGKVVPTIEQCGYLPFQLFTIGLRTRSSL